MSNQAAKNLADHMQSGPLDSTGESRNAGTLRSGMPRTTDAKKAAAQKEVEEAAFRSLHPGSVFPLDDLVAAHAADKELADLEAQLPDSKDVKGGKYKRSKKRKSRKSKKRKSKKSKKRKSKKSKKRKSKKSRRKHLA